MEADDLLQWSGEKPRGIRVAQIGLCGEGEQGNVGERRDVFRGETTLIHALAEERDILVAQSHDVLQTRKLETTQLVAGHEIGVGNGMRDI